MDMDVNPTPVGEEKVNELLNTFDMIISTVKETVGKRNCTSLQLQLITSVFEKSKRNLDGVIRLLNWNDAEKNFIGECQEICQGDGSPISVDE